MTANSELQSAIDEALRRASLPAAGDAEAGMILLSPEASAPPADAVGDDGD